jgi:hypothetical protein
VMTPQPESASPPSGVAGTGSGCGGSPAFGTSDESTAGGVVTRYGQGSGAALGSALATAGPAIKRRAAASAAARADAVRKFAIVTAD